MRADVALLLDFDARLAAVDERLGSLEREPRARLGLTEQDLVELRGKKPAATRLVQKVSRTPKH